MFFIRTSIKDRHGLLRNATDRTRDILQRVSDAGFKLRADVAPLPPASIAIEAIDDQTSEFHVVYSNSLTPRDMERTALELARKLKVAVLDLPVMTEVHGAFLGAVGTA